jgi:hypothetical protein
MKTTSWLRNGCTLFATCAALIALALPAFADGHKQGKHCRHQMPAYSELDFDGDNKVTAEEFYKFRAARMEKRAAEGRKMKNAANAPAFEDLDLDADGSLSAEEFAEHHAQCPMHGKKKSAPETE